MEKRSNSIQPQVEHTLKPRKKMKLKYLYIPKKNESLPDIQKSPYQLWKEQRDAEKVVDPPMQPFRVYK